MVLPKLKVPLGSPCLNYPAGSDKYFLSLFGIGTMY